MVQRIGFEEIPEDPLAVRLWVSSDEGLVATQEVPKLRLRKPVDPHEELSELSEEGKLVVNSIRRVAGVREISRIDFDYVDVIRRRIFDPVEVERAVVAAVATALGWATVDVVDMYVAELGWTVHPESPVTITPPATEETPPTPTEVGAPAGEKAKTILELGFFEVFRRRGVGTRYYKALRDHGIWTLNSLLEVSREELVDIPYISDTAVDEIERRLAEMGLALRGSQMRDVSQLTAADELVREEGAFGPLPTSPELTGEGPEEGAEEAGDQPEVLEDPRD